MDGTDLSEKATQVMDLINNDKKKLEKDKSDKSDRICSYIFFYLIVQDQNFNSLVILRYELKTPAVVNASYTVLMF